MNNKELLKSKIELLTKELKWATSEYQRLNAGLDAFGEPGSLSEQEVQSMKEKSEKRERREAFSRLKDEDFMKKILENIK